MVNLSTPELETTLSLANLVATPPTLLPKLQAALSDGLSEHSLEVSEEEVELILDNLNPPQTASAAENSLRTKLTTFLATARA